MAKKANHFVDNEKLYEAYQKYYVKKLAALEKGESPPPLSDEIGQAILLIATNLARKPVYSYRPYKEEMIGHAIITCVKYAHNFNPTLYKNPFSYLTRICINAFIQHTGKEMRQWEIKRKYMSQVLYPTIIGTEEGERSAVKMLMDAEDNRNVESKKFEKDV